MNFGLITIEQFLSTKQAAKDILSCNEQTSAYGLVLGETDAAELIETREEVLKSNGRIEFGGGIINKLILEFKDSPYIIQENYSSILNELIEIFYYFKNEWDEEISDDELIELMKRYFDNNCQGDIELLKQRELETLARNLKYEIEEYYDIKAYDPEEYYEYYDEEKWYDEGCGEYYGEEGWYDEDEWHE